MENNKINSSVWDNLINKIAQNDMGNFVLPHNISHLLLDALKQDSLQDNYDDACGSSGFLNWSKTIETDRPHLLKQDEEIDYRKISIQHLLPSSSIEEKDSEFTNFSIDKVDHFITGNTTHKKQRYDVIIPNPPYTKTQVNDYIITHPPFIENNNNINNWIELCINKLSAGGRCCLFLPFQFLFSSRYAKIRKRLILDQYLNCIINLPDYKFYSNSHGCVISLEKNVTGKEKNDILVIDGIHTRRDKSIHIHENSFVKDWVQTYESWRGYTDKIYNDIPGFCKSVNIQEIAEYEYNLLPRIYLYPENHNEQKIGQLNINIRQKKDGISIAYIPNRVEKVYFFQKVNIDTFRKYDESKYLGIYFLVGKDNNINIVYVGYSQEIYTRLNQHINKKEKEFWINTFVLVSINNSLNKAQGDYLEKKFIQLLSRSPENILYNDHLYKKDNKNTANLNDFDLEDTDDFFNHAKEILRKLGLKIGGEHT